MKNRDYVYGIACGIFVSIGMIGWWLFPSQHGRIIELGTSMMFVLGLMVMILGYMAIVVAHKRTRMDEHGPISFLRLFKSGLIITLVATVIYVGIWMIVYNNGGTELMDVIQEGHLARIRESGLADELKEVKLADHEKFIENYRENALYRMWVTTLEVFPVGLAYSLLSALVFRRKKQTFFA